jgi:hypothetical protein
MCNDWQTYLKRISMILHLLLNKVDPSLRVLFQPLEVVTKFLPKIEPVGAHKDATCCVEGTGGPV